MKSIYTCKQIFTYKLEFLAELKNLSKCAVKYEKGAQKRMKVEKIKKMEHC